MLVALSTTTVQSWYRRKELNGKVITYNYIPVLFLLALITMIWDGDKLGSRGVDETLCHLLLRVDLIK
jgi:hypothetical protein